MAVLRIDRFKVDPADTEELIARRNAVIDAVRRGGPGLVQSWLTKLDDETWLDVSHWDSMANAQAHVERARAGDIPEAVAAFALTKDATTQFAEVVDER